MLADRAKWKTYWQEQTGGGREVASPTRFEADSPDAPSVAAPRNINPDSAIADVAETDEGGVNRVETSQHFTVSAQPEDEE